MPAEPRAPFLAALLQQVRTGGWLFHTPGHKGGKAGDREWRTLVGPAQALDLDPPWLPSAAKPGEVRAPAQVVREAEDLLARAYGASRSLFLVNGATAGLQALLLATTAGGTLLLPRNAHRSVLGALALADAWPLYLPAAVDDRWGLPTAPRLPVPPRFPAVQAALATYPDYYGLACDLAGWRAALVAGARSAALATGGQASATIPLLVDEAHGPHLPWLSQSMAPGRLPRPALELGADAAVQSPHKLLGSLVQSAWLHLAPPRPTGRVAVEASRVEAALAALTTTSPSFLLLGSLDAVRRWAEAEGRAAYGRLADLSQEIRAAVDAVPGLKCLDEAEAVRMGYVALDPAKVTVSVRELGLTGPEAAAFLRWRGIQAELADPCNVLFVLSPADTPESGAALLEGLRALSQAAARPVDRARLTAGRRPGTPSPGEIAALLEEVAALAPERACSPREALLGPSEQVLLGRAAGRIAARPVGVYPPGIPVIAPGELLTPAHVRLLERLAAAGLPADGLERSSDAREGGADEYRLPVVARRGGGAVI